MNARRSFLRSTAIVCASLSVGSLTGCRNASKAPGSQIDKIGALRPPDENGVMLADGFTSRVISRSGTAPHTGSTYLWHAAPDGGAVFPTESSGWIYVSNSEVGENRGGVGAIRFDASGNITGAYPILENSDLNCGGGSTPWNTWLSCEEASKGIIWECDPNGQFSAIPRAGLGVFAHEAVTADTQQNILYMTEDKHDGCLYRFVPDSLNSQGYPDLSNGILEVAIVDWPVSTVSWIPVPDPSASTKRTRYQIPGASHFNGGEGIVYYDGVISFATKRNNVIWSYDTKTDRISVTYSARRYSNPILTGVDNITLTKNGELVVGEDGGNMQVVAITKSGGLIPLVQLVGHDSSEITGPAFSPDGNRLYFSSQRGAEGTSMGGMTFEVMGPFHS